MTSHDPPLTSLVFSWMGGSWTRSCVFMLDPQALHVCTLSSLTTAKENEEKIDAAVVKVSDKPMDCELVSGILLTIVRHENPEED